MDRDRYGNKSTFDERIVQKTTNPPGGKANPYDLMMNEKTKVFSNIIFDPFTYKHKFYDYDVEKINRYTHDIKGHEKGIVNDMVAMTSAYSNIIDTNVAYGQRMLSQCDLSKLPDFMKKDMPNYKTLF